MDREFEKPDFSVPMFLKGNIADSIGLENNQRYYFSKEGLLYWDSYTYRTGTEVGLCCVLVDFQKTFDQIESILTDEQGIRVLYQGKEIFTIGDVESRPLSLTQSGDNDFSYELYAPKFTLLKNNTILIGMLTVLMIVAAIFIWIAYWEILQAHRLPWQNGQLAAGWDKSGVKAKSGDQAKS